MSKPKKRKLPPRPKAYYPLDEVKQMVLSGKAVIHDNAKRCAKDDFGWGTKDILDTLLFLKQHHFQKSNKSELSPLITVDSYKVRFNGEDVYTHFYINEFSGELVINSFKQDTGEL